MKRSKRLSFLVALIIAITNIAFIGIPSVGAEGSEFIVSDDFENYTAVLQDGEAATLESMQELCNMNPWWYSVKSTVFNKAADVGAKTPLIASVVSDGNNNALRLTYHAEAGVGTNIATPTQANQFVYGNGSYEVSFKFKTTDDVRIYGVGGKQENETATFYHHNILTKSGDDTYMGDTEASSPAGSGMISPAPATRSAPAITMWRLARKPSLRRSPPFWRENPSKMWFVLPYPSAATATR